jgi:hypothetical protein
MILAQALMTYFRSNQSSSLLQLTEVVNFTIEKPVSEVKDIIGDLRTFGDYHPLITSVTETSESTYEVKERPYSWLPLSIRYSARIELQSDTRIIYRISKLVLFKPRFTYEFLSEESKSTNFQFTIQIEGPPLGRKILLNKMIDAQVRLWQAVVD